MKKNIIQYIHKSIIPIFVSIICMYALYLRLMVLHRHTLWADELWQIGAMKGSFLDLIRILPQFDYFTYLNGDFYLIYPFFKIFSYNKWGLALPHIVITIAGFYLLYLICKRYFKSVWAYVITFAIVCFNATLINHATEIRAYAILPTLALGMFYSFQRISDFNFKLNGSKKIGAIVLFVLMIWFHVYGIMMFFTSFLFVILSRCREERFKPLLKDAAGFVALVLCLAMPFWVYSIFRPHIDYGLMKVHTFYYFPNPLTDILGFLKAIFGNLIGFKKLYFLLLGMFLPFIFFYRDKYKQLLFLFLNIFLPVSFILLSDLATKYWFLQRQFIWVMPLFAFFLGWTWDALFMIITSRIQKRKGA